MTMKEVIRLSGVIPVRTFLIGSAVALSLVLFAVHITRSQEDAGAFEIHGPGALREADRLLVLTKLTDRKMIDFYW